EGHHVEHGLVGAQRHLIDLVAALFAAAPHRDFEHSCHRCPTRRPQFAVTPAALMTGVMRAISLSTRACKPAGPRSGALGAELPSSAKRCWTVGSSSALLSASASLATISGGVPLGATIPFQALNTKSSPASRAVGTSGRLESRSGAAMA